MRKALFTIAALTGCALSSGCVTAAVGAAASVGLFAVQDRTIGQGIDDAAASQQVKARLLAADTAGYAQVDVEVAGGDILLSGAAPSEQHKQTAEMIARSVRSIRNVYNEIVVGPNKGLVRAAADDLITAQVRARFMASSSVRSVNLNIETFQGNVYLMGTARTDLELQRSAEIASTVAGVNRVVSFVQVLEWRAPSYAQTPPAPEFRGAPAGEVGAYASRN